MAALCGDSESKDETEDDTAGVIPPDGIPVVAGFAGFGSSFGALASDPDSPDCAGVPVAFGRLGDRLSVALAGCLPRGIVAMGPTGAADGRSVAGCIGVSRAGGALILTLPVLAWWRHSPVSPVFSPAAAASPPNRLSPCAS